MKNISLQELKHPVTTKHKVQNEDAGIHDEVLIFH